MAEETRVLASPQEGAAADWTVSQDWSHDTREKRTISDTPFARQAKLLPVCASDAYPRGVDVLKLSKPGFPDFAELSERLT